MLLPLSWNLSRSLHMGLVSLLSVIAAVQYALSLTVSTASVSHIDLYIWSTWLSVDSLSSLFILMCYLLHIVILLWVTRRGAASSVHALGNWASLLTLFSILMFLAQDAMMLYLAFEATLIPMIGMMSSLGSGFRRLHAI